MKNISCLSIIFTYVFYTVTSQCEGNGLSNLYMSICSVHMAELAELTICFTNNVYGLNQV